MELNKEKKQSMELAYFSYPGKIIGKSFLNLEKDES